MSIGPVAEDEIEFDLVGLDPSLANAFRRILISEVPHIFTNLFIASLFINRFIFL